MISVLMRAGLCPDRVAATNRITGPRQPEERPQARSIASEGETNFIVSGVNISLPAYLLAG